MSDLPLDSICYNVNFLTDVVLRIDFVSPIPRLGSPLPSTVSKAILSHFPIPDPQKVVVQKFNFVPEQGIQPSQDSFTTWRFLGRAREKQLNLSLQYLFISYSKYTNYESLQREFVLISEALLREMPEIQISRLGLRYINQVEQPGTDPFDWEGLLERDLVALLHYSVPDSQPCRIFHNLEYSFPEHQLRFQFGLFNTDYPAAIRRRHFILDYDAFFQGPIEQAEVTGMADLFHSRIQNLFERNIEDRLREVLRGQQ